MLRNSLSSHSLVINTDNISRESGQVGLNNQLYLIYSLIIVTLSGVPGVEGYLGRVWGENK